MLELDAQTVIDLPVNGLGLAVLADFDATDATDAWSEYSYLLEAESSPRLRISAEAPQAISEALGWLRNRGLLARKPCQSDANTVFITRAPRAALRDGLASVRAAERLQEGLHPAVEARARRQFLLAEHEQAVFVAMKAVEVRVRALTGLGEDAVGVDLMNKAFGTAGPLTDQGAVRGEQEGTRALFAGAYGALRNPAGHREVDYDYVAEAAEAVTVASLLMRILDRVEQRRT